MPRFAAIDVGSNALRLRVVEASAPSPRVKGQVALTPEGLWRDLATLRSPVRLGAEVFVSGRLAPASIGQACDALREVRQEMDRWEVDAYRAIATSAVREGQNGGAHLGRGARAGRDESQGVVGVGGGRRGLRAGS